LNASSLGHWTQWAEQIQEAGADAIECNIDNIPTDMNKAAAQVEAVYLEVLKALSQLSQYLLPLSLVLISLTWPTWLKSWTALALMDWFSSTAFTSPILISRI
jgi:hypothetical protein